MERIIVNGAKKLSGEISVSGSKNAALPLIFSTIAINGVSTILGVPDIGDVRVALDILREFGAEILRCENTLVIDTRYLKYCEPSAELVSKIRASSYLLGACLARFSRAKIYNFGGCNFCSRPIDMHLYAMKSLGASIIGDEIRADKLTASDIFFEKASVGATINAVILASSAVGTTRIFGYAREPHVLSLVKFLRSAGVKISFMGSHVEITGSNAFCAKTKLIPDMIEAGTYVALSLMTDSELLIKGADADHLSSLISVLSRAGAKFKIDENGIIPYGKITSPITVTTAPYPAFPTDLQPIIAPLLAISEGGVINECVWQNRFGYLSELCRLGLIYQIEGNSALISKSKLISGKTAAPDLRGGAALLLAALCTEGKSEIKNAEIIFRGYENLDKKLGSIGAGIEIIK